MSTPTKHTRPFTFRGVIEEGDNIRRADPEELPDFYGIYEDGSDGLPMHRWDADDMHSAVELCCRLNDDFAINTDLLAALKALVAEADYQVSIGNMAADRVELTQARAAIAKAEQNI